MAMTKCRECGYEISSRATKCPSCGIDNPTKVGGCAQSVLALLMLPFIIAIIAIFCKGALGV